MDGYLFTNNSGNYNIPINTSGSSSGNTITLPTNTWVPGQIVYTITIGGGGGGGGGAIAAPADAPKEKKKDKGGCSCKKCREFYEFAEPNQEDGTLVCWSCRHGY